MKKGVVLLSLILFCLTGFARDLGTSWVVTGDGKMDCKKIDLGYNKARIMLNNGQKVTISFSNISSFSTDGRIFVKLRLFEDNKPTGKLAFMELIKTWNDLSLYKLAVYDLKSPIVHEVSYNYYIYQGMNYYLHLDDRSLQNTCMHFRLNKSNL